ncbi:MAG: hypothetical protein HY695_05300 [Deltaproteobacteria bacterium]|nr:hypothetical protein [Deltaproteobacteria bacterium]
MITLQSFVLETLTSEFVERLNFEFGPMRVYPSGYRNDIAGCIRNGRIRITSDPSTISSSPSSVDADGSYAIDTPRGQIHPFFIHPRWTILTGGELYLKDGLSGNESASLRGTIIHEATHALQDWQRAQLDPPTAEGAAYLAGAIARRLWGYRTLGRIENPQASGHAYALTLADRFLAEPNGARRYHIPTDDVATLKSLVSTVHADRYVFNGI